MKSLIVFPPMWSPATPYLSVPLLVGQARKNGLDTEGWDLNVDFYNDILNSKNLRSVLALLKKEYEEFKNKRLNVSNEKYKVLDKLFTKESYKIKNSLEYIDIAMKTLKTDDFYNPTLYLKAKKIISYSLDIISLKYFPVKISLSDYINPNLELTYGSIINACENEKENIYIENFRKQIKQKITNDVSFVGISVAHKCQLIGALTLAREIKKYKNIHVCIGGNLITRINDIFINTPEMFGTYFDSILSGDGEHSIVKLIKTVESGDCKFDLVDGLIYKNKQNKICKNKNKLIKNFEKINPLDFYGFDFSKYLIPKIIIPMQLTKGCYWGKCTFCDFFFGKDNYIEKNIENIINEIKYLKEKYNILNFEFVDEAIPPQLYSQLADKLIEENIKINFYSMVRAENGFEVNLLEKLKKAGLKMLFWGLESGCEKTIKTMNKGINLKKAIEVLKNSSDVDIWNHSYFIVGFPLETTEDINITKNFILSNHYILDSYSVQAYTLNKHSKISEFPERFGVNGIEDYEPFSPVLSYNNLNIKSKEIDNYLFDIHSEYLKRHDKALWKILIPDEYLFLYVIKYGKQWVKNYIFEQNSKIPNVQT